MSDINARTILSEILLQFTMKAQFMVENGDYETEKEAMDAMIDGVEENGCHETAKLFRLYRDHE